MFMFICQIACTVDKTFLSGIFGNNIKVQKVAMGQNEHVKDLVWSSLMSLSTLSGYVPERLHNNSPKSVPIPD